MRFKSYFQLFNPNTGKIFAQSALASSKTDFFHLWELSRNISFLLFLDAFIFKMEENNCLMFN